MADDRDDNGKFSQQYPDEAFLSAVKSTPVPSTKNVAEKIGCSYNLTYQRLKELEKEGEVRSEEVGASFVWVRL